MEDVYNEIIENIRESEILVNEPMKRHTTFRIGGPADIFIKVKSIEDLKNIVKIAKKGQKNITVIGNGSNILVKDKGIRGIVLKLELDNIFIDGTKIEVEAGVPLSKVCIEAQKNNLTGLEFAYGIPGTIGGAIYMNAGAYGKEMKEVVINTTYLDEKLDIKTITNAEQQFSYRQSIFMKKNVIILSTTLSLQIGIKEEIKQKMDEYLNLRKSKQPLNFPNAGSTFKRGKNYITSKLIDEVGLKGYNIGDAMVSNIHAGFIVNKGNATAEDVLKLVKYIQTTIKNQFNYDIELEIKILGE